MCVHNKAIVFGRVAHTAGAWGGKRGKGRGARAAHRKRPDTKGAICLSHFEGGDGGQVQEDTAKPLEEKDHYPGVSSDAALVTKE